MTFCEWRLAVVGQAALLSFLAVLPARGEVKEVAGTVATTIIQYNGGSEVQRDVGQEVVPLSTPVPPAVAPGL